MKYPPKISVIIPAYNCEQFISETLESVFNQTFQAFEVIVVNDGSTDKTSEVLQKFNHRITIINKRNGGVSSARNAGILSATGDWVAFLDADDFWAVNKLELFSNVVLEQPDAILIYSEFTAWLPDDNGNFSSPDALLIPNNSVEPDHMRTGWMYHMQLLTNWVLTSTAMIDVNSLRRIGIFDEYLAIAEDWDLFIRASRVGTFYKIKQPLTLYRESPDSLTKSVKTRDFASDIIHSAVAKYGIRSPNGECVDKLQFKSRSFTRHFDYGLAAFKQKWYRKSSNAMFRAIKYKPFAAKAWIYFFLARIVGIFNKTTQTE